MGDKDVVAMNRMAVSKKKFPNSKFLLSVLILVSIAAVALINRLQPQPDVYTNAREVPYSVFARTDNIDVSLVHNNLEIENSSEKFTFLEQEDGLGKRVFLPIIYHTQFTVYYISKLGDNTDGKSWSTAWNELDQINWNLIQPGDLILLDGGSDQMTYATTLRVEKGGTFDKPVRIMLADEVGRNGKVIIFGGRSTPLPYCGQLNYTYQDSNVRDSGIIIEEVSWVVIDGMKWRGITIHGHRDRGIRLTRGETNNITIRNVEIYDNGMASQNDDGEWRPNISGVGLAGSNNTFERAIIHDNGQDAIQSMSGANNIAEFTIRQSWLYNSRKHPTVDESFNYCRHSDGLQIYAGGNISGVTIEESIIGPGFTQGIILGQTSTEPDTPETIVNNVTIRNSLFIKAAGLNIMGYSDIKAQGWVLDHVTSYCPSGYTGVCLWLEGTDHTVTNSIFSGSRFVLPDGLDTYNGNCQWETEGFQLGKIADPLFKSVNENNPFSLDDYALLSNSPCAGKGSNITSVAQLLALP